MNNRKLIKSIAEDILNSIESGECFQEQETNDELCEDLDDLIHKLQNFESEEKECD